MREKIVKYDTIGREAETAIKNDVTKGRKQSKIGTEKNHDKH